MAVGGRQASLPQMNPPTPASLYVVRRRCRRCHSQSAPDPNLAPAPVTAAKARLIRARSERRREGDRERGGASGAGAGRRGRGSHIRVLRRAGGGNKIVTSSVGWRGGSSKWRRGDGGVARGGRDF